MAKSAAVQPRRSWFWLQGMACGVAAAIIPGTSLVIAVSLAPAIAVYVMETTSGRPLARAMIFMGTASTMMPLRLLWEHGGSLDAALDLLSDPGRPLLSWLACGAAWFLGQSAEIVTRFALEARAKMAVNALTAERETLKGEWLDGRLG